MAAGLRSQEQGAPMFFWFLLTRPSCGVGSLGHVGDEAVSHVRAGQVQYALKTDVGQNGRKPNKFFPHKKMDVSAEVR